MNFRKVGFGRRNENGRIKFALSKGNEPEYQILPVETAHDLSVEEICGHLCPMEPERKMIMSILTHISGDPRVIQYRCDIFEDILKLRNFGNSFIN